MQSLDMFSGTKSKCREFAKAPLSEVAVDIMFHMSKTYVIIHDYYSAFLAVEAIDTSKKNLEREGREVTDLLSKYFLDIFDCKVKFMKSDSGQTDYTNFITNFCTKNNILHFFPATDVMPGISKITIQSMKNLLDECGSEIEAQIAIGVFRDTGTDSTRSPNHLLFYEKEKQFKWDDSKYKKNLDFTYAQVSLMKSKLDQEVLAFASTLRKQSKNSCNFRVDYPALLQNKETTLKNRVCDEFVKRFMEIMTIIETNKNSNSTTPGTNTAQELNSASGAVPANTPENLRAVSSKESEMSGPINLCALCSSEMSEDNACGGVKLYCPKCSVSDSIPELGKNSVSVNSVDSSTVASAPAAPKLEISVRRKTQCPACNGRHGSVMCPAATHLCTQCWKKGHYPELCPNADKIMNTESEKHDVINSASHMQSPNLLRSWADSIY